MKINDIIKLNNRCNEYCSVSITSSSTQSGAYYIICDSPSDRNILRGHADPSEIDSMIGGIGSIYFCKDNKWHFGHENYEYYFNSIEEAKHELLMNYQNIDIKLSRY
jgi:hypothetical protein